MMSYEVHGLRVSSSAVRDALQAGELAMPKPCWVARIEFQVMWYTVVSWVGLWGFEP